MDWELVLGIGRFVLATTLILLLTVPNDFVIIQMEMKIIAQLALRIGPNRIGPRGLFQSTIHGFKVLAKEDTVPDQADRGTFTLAPWMVYMAAGMGKPGNPLPPRALEGLFGGGHEHARHPVRPWRHRQQHEHRHRLLLRGAGALGGRPAR